MIFGETTRILGQSLNGWLERQKNAGRLQDLIVFLHGSAKEWELTDWPIVRALPRLRDHGAQITFVLTKKEVASPDLELQQKLELHRMSASSQMSLIDQFPGAGKLVLLGYARVAGRIVGIATEDAAASLPGPAWGIGDKKPLVFGEATVSQKIAPMQMERLIQWSMGNAKHIPIKDQIDGVSTGFGRRFWKLLGQSEPLGIANLREEKVAQIRYRDRYLRSPLSIKLLVEVLESAPGKTAQTKVEISTVPLESGGLLSS